MKARELELGHLLHTGSGQVVEIWKIEPHGLLGGVLNLHVRGLQDKEATEVYPVNKGAGVILAQPECETACPHSLKERHD